MEETKGIVIVDWERWRNLDDEELNNQPDQLFQVESYLSSPGRIWWTTRKAYLEYTEACRQMNEEAWSKMLDEFKQSEE